MLSQIEVDRQKRRAKRRSVKATEYKKFRRRIGAKLRILEGESPRTLWHPENW